MLMFMIYMSDPLLLINIFGWGVFTIIAWNVYVSCWGVFLRNLTFRYANAVNLGVNLKKMCF